jgi:hypothetical protein
MQIESRDKSQQQVRIPTKDADGRPVIAVVQPGKGKELGTVIRVIPVPPSKGGSTRP